MHIRYLSRLDANLLVALDVLLDERSVSRAAVRLLRTQPAMSRILVRLRDALDDPILVREGRAMVPTPRALALHAPLRRALVDLASAIRAPEPFDPVTSRREFRLSAADYAQVGVLGTVRHALRALGSQVRLCVLPASAAFQDLLEDGRAELSVGGAPPDRAWIAHESVAKIGWSCAVARDGDFPTTPEAFAAQDHLLIGVDNAPTFVDRALIELGLRRRIAMSVPDFAGALFVVASSDLVLTLPDGLAAAARTLAGLQVRPHPLRLPDVDITMSWHARNTHDPGLVWFRELVRAAM